jgi:hypothetical protein
MVLFPDGGDKTRARKRARAGLDTWKNLLLISSCALQAPAGSREGPSPLPN